MYALRLDQEIRPELYLSARELSGLDWGYVLKRARQDRIGPMLYRCLRDKAGIPEHAMAGLELLYHSTAYFTARLRADLGEILRAFSGDKIETIVLKGGVLGEMVYRDPGLRWMCDLDLLVREGDVRLANRRLRCLGWIPRLEKTRAVEHHLPPYVREGSRGAVELHRHVGSAPGPFMMDLEGLWRRARPVHIAGVDVWALCPEDLLLHLCLHASRRGRGRITVLALHSAYDIALTVRQYREELDWRSVVDRADAYEVCDVVYWALYSARDMCGASVPEQVIEDLEGRMTVVLSPRCLDLQRRMVRIHLQDPVAQAGGLSFRVWPYGRGATDKATLRECLRADIRSVHRPSDLLVLLWGPLCYIARGSRVAAACAGLFDQVLASAYRSRTVRGVARTLYRVRFR